MKPHAIALACLTLAATACETIDSGDLLTSGMAMNLTATTEGDGETEVSAVIRAGGLRSNTFVDLLGDDELNVTSGELASEMTKRQLGNLISYGADLPVDAAGTEFVVSLDRTVDAGAPSSTVTLPEPFAFGSTGDAFDADTNLAFDWTPANSTDEMEVLVDGDCIVLWAKELDGDPGAFEIPGDEINLIGDEPGTSCSVDITLRRVNGGSVDSAFEEGVAQGVQRRSFSATFSASE